jgi:hypothetical protein
MNKDGTNIVLGIGLYLSDEIPKAKITVNINLNCIRTIPSTPTFRQLHYTDNRLAITFIKPVPCRVQQDPATTFCPGLTEISPIPQTLFL